MAIVHNELNQQTWDAFVQKHGPRSGRFLQSWNWGEFMNVGAPLVGAHHVIDRVAWMSETDDVNAVAQVIRKTIPHFGTYAYVPRGPILAPSPFEGEGGERGVTEERFLDGVVRNDMFLRIELASEHVLENASEHLTHALSFERRGVTRTENIQPAHTLITNLSLSTDELLANMHEKTRYNIRLAEKKGVQIEMRSATIDEVWPVFEATSSRDTFRLHSKDYYRNMLNACTPPAKEGTGEVFLAIAKHENDILAANIMIDFGDTRTYLHGASSNVKRNLMAPYLLHWELMKDAQSRGIKFYDWWGVAPVDAPADHKWSGISRFKRGFGGEEVSYPDAFDVVLKPMRYTAYRFARSLRRILR